MLTGWQDGLILLYNVCRFATKGIHWHLLPFLGGILQHTERLNGAEDVTWTMTCRFAIGLHRTCWVVSNIFGSLIQTVAGGGTLEKSDYPNFGPRIRQVSSAITSYCSFQIDRLRTSAPRSNHGIIGSTMNNSLCQLLPHHHHHHHHVSAISLAKIHIVSKLKTFHRNLPKLWQEVPARPTVMMYSKCCSFPKFKSFQS